MALPVKRRALSLHDKMKILKYFDKKSENYKKSQIAEELDIPISTLSTILKNRRDTEDKCKNLSSRALRRKKNKMGKFTELENILVDWIYSMNSQNIQTNGPAIKKRALEIASDLDITDFTGSCGWLGRFKKRHEISLKHTEDTDSGGEDESVASLDTFQDIVKDYQPSDIFNADEFGLFYRLTPNEDFNKQDKKCENGSSSSERLTVLACVNANGTEKLPLLVIGNTAQTIELPCQYEVERNSWMTRDIFVNWLKVLDDYFEIQGRLIVLFVDNSPTHPKDIVLNNINLVLLPPDSEYEMPMTQGIVKSIKQNYRTRLIEISQDIEDICTFKDNFSVSRCLGYICDSWDAVKPGTVQSCFQKSGLGDYYDVDDDDEEYKAEILMKYHDYLYIDYDLATCAVQDSVEATDLDYRPDDEGTDEVYLKEKYKKVGDVTSNQAAATALTSVANLKQYLSSIKSREGLDNLVVIENLVLKSIDDSNACS